MPATLTPSVSQVKPALVHHRFSVDQYERMVETGIITENDRVELIRGEIVRKMGVGSRHISCINRLNELLSEVLRRRAIVSIQNPIRLSDSEPEPDLVILKRRADFYAGAKARAASVMLVIEVADSTIDYDRGIKLGLYAQAKIAEFWIVNLVDDCLEVYRKPRANGSYAEMQTLRRGESLSPIAFPDLKLAVSDIL